MCDQRRAMADGVMEGESWRSGMPTKFRRDILVPVRFELHHDEMSGASRVLGYSSNDELCYCRARASVETLFSDDDEEYFVAPSLVIRQVSWRLRDGRWLGCRRENEAPGNCRAGSSRFSITPALPR